MKKYYKIWIPAILVLLIAYLVFVPLRKWGRAHVNYMTAVDDHPLLCTNCHLYTQKSGLFYALLNTTYLSPFNLVVSKDGEKIFVVAEESDHLLIVDAVNKKVLKKIKVGDTPHSVVLNKNETLAYVSNQWSDNVSVIDLEKAEIIDTIKTGNGPAGLVLSKDENFLFVVNSYSSNISVINLQNNEEIKRLMAGNNPTGAGLSPDGNKICVSSRRALLLPSDQPPLTEVTILNTVNQRVYDRKIFESAYMIENISFTPEGDLAIMPLIRPKNLIPSVQVERGWIMTYGIGIIEMKENGRHIQLLLDEPNAYYSDPFDIEITPDGKKAFISHSGVDLISVVDVDSIRKLINESSDEELKMYADHLGISSKYVIKRISTGANPKGMALSPDGKLLYIAEHLDDRIAIVNTESLENIGTIDLGGPKRFTVARHGRQLFNNSSHTFQNQFGCYTCHPDAHEDGLVYNMASIDMGRNLANTQSLRDIGDTPPYKWNGKNQTVYKQDGMRFSTVLTRTEAFSHEELDALVSYIITGITYPPNLQYNPDGKLTEAQLRGKAIFERTHDNFGNVIPVKNRCITCHPAPYYTHCEMEDVGTLAESDDSMLFDTPHLNNIYASPPYLHDGSALTLEEIWTKRNDHDQHGVGNDMMKDQLNDLVEYLKSLSAPEYENKKQKTYPASIKKH